jgi:hypothetical protein
MRFTNEPYSKFVGSQGHGLLHGDTLFRRVGATADHGTSPAVPESAPDVTVSPAKWGSASALPHELSFAWSFKMPFPHRLLGELR